MLLIDGGDLGCGELLLVIHRQVRDLADGTVVGIATTDPAAPIDLPAWCHLTGHRYHGQASAAKGEYFLVEVVRQASTVDPHHLWHRRTATSTTAETT
jgi:tRNA 2-thiouridine synthesizing protein A